MSLVRPIDFSKTPNYPRWLLKDLLPAHELVVLDGSTGVGKTLALAVLSEQISKLPGQNILYLSSHDQEQSRNMFLSRQQAQGKNIRAIDFTPSLPDSDLVLRKLIRTIGESLNEYEPSVFILDGIEELLSYQTEMKTELSRFFWNSLRRYAADYCCTIIVTRTQGLNESRSYGTFTKLGSDHARFALAMHWHPHAPEERILTVIKHQFGPIGKQFHLQFENNQAVLKSVEKDHYQRPAKSAPTYQATKTARTPAALTFTPQELEVVHAIEEMTQSGVPSEDIHQKLTHTGYAHTLLEAVEAKLNLCRKNEQACAQKNQALVQHLLKPAHTAVAA